MADSEKPFLVRLSPLSNNTRTLLLLLLLFLLVLGQSIENVDSAASDGSSRRKGVEWQILTKLNYSSEIRRHPNLLLMITLPWCGESRSLQKLLANAVTTQRGRFGYLKLMLLYRNTERMLANALGASESDDAVTIIYFHHSLSYMYRGTLRVQNILSSVHHVMSFLPEQLPLRLLRTSHELRNFLDSTDKTLLLLDFCGWTPGLLAGGSSEETNGTLVQEKKQQKVEGLKMGCSADKGFNQFPWLTELTSGNDGNMSEADKITHTDGFSCMGDELQRLKSFLPKLMKFARDFFLPPERLGFGLVSEKSLLSELDIEASAAPWLMKLYSAGCPTCSKVLTEGDDLKATLQTQESVVTELTDDMYDVPTLPANRASILLFIDRSSDSLSISKESKEALDAFRQLAMHHHISNHMPGGSTIKLIKLSDETSRGHGTSGVPKLEQRFPAFQKLNVKDKMSVMIMNDQKQISLENFISDLQGSSLHEILENLLQKKKELKLSSLAKDAGFQLLSEDFEIKDAEPLPVQPEFQSNLEFSQKDDVQDTFGLDKDMKLQKPVSFNPVTDEESRLTDATSSYLVHQNYPIWKDESSTEFNDIHTTKGVGYGQERTSEEERLAGVHDQIQHKGFSGSFFFCDGQSRLLGALTASLKIPSVVIIDPIMQKHFILPETAALSYSLLSNFLDGFLNESLPPYQQSETVLRSPREAPVPPFVNLDFHEAESIPRVTAHTFSELVLGNRSDSVNNGNPQDKDVLVLLSNSWCGFCQRMEMVVREVFGAIQGYDGSSNKNSLLTKDNIRSSTKIPLIYLMDCTLNDCSWILKSVVKREIYPSLLLFPAGRKNVITYEGDVAVYDVIKFLSDHGTLVNEKDISWGEVKEGGSFSITAPLSQSTYYEVFLEDQKREVAATQFRVQSSGSGSHESTSSVVPGSILTATDKLLNVQPFDESKILIVKVNQGTGFEGLMVNKHINWDSLEELEEGLQKLKGAPLSYGGPVMKQGMPLVALAQKFEDDKHPEVLPDVYFLDQWATLRLMEELKLGNKSVRGHWFFLGFSSWGWEQLFHEIAEGAWHVSKGDTEQLDWPDIF